MLRNKEILIAFLFLSEARVTCVGHKHLLRFQYSTACLKRSLKRSPKNIFKTDDCLKQGKALDLH